MVDVANCTDVEMRFIPFEFSTCGTDGERGTTVAVVVRLRRGSEVEDSGRVEE
jgi:hypothetical protein